MIQKGDLGSDCKFNDKEIEAINDVLTKTEEKAQFQLDEITNKPLRDKEDFEKSLDIRSGKKTDFKKYNTSVEKLAKIANGMTEDERYGFEEGIMIFLNGSEFIDYNTILREIEVSSV